MRNLVAMIKCCCFQEKNPKHWWKNLVHTKYSTHVFYNLSYSKLDNPLQHCYYFWKTVGGSFLGRKHILATSNSMPKHDRCEWHPLCTLVSKMRKPVTTCLYCILARSLDLNNWGTENPRYIVCLFYSLSQSEWADTN